MESLWTGLKSVIKCGEVALFLISLRELEDNLDHCGRGVGDIYNSVNNKNEFKK